MPYYEYTKIAKRGNALGCLENVGIINDIGISLNIILMA
jgi:hypothetical protein